MSSSRPIGAGPPGYSFSPSDDDTNLNHHRTDAASTPGKKRIASSGPPQEGVKKTKLHSEFNEAAALPSPFTLKNEDKRVQGILSLGWENIFKNLTTSIYKTKLDDGREIVLKITSSKHGQNEVLMMQRLFEDKIPHSIPLLASGFIPGRGHFLAMPCYPKGDMLNEKLPLSLEKIQKVALQILTYLAELEKRNFVHRDIKPENLFLTEDGELRVGDIATMTNPKTIHFDPTQLPDGTRGFMAPEVLTGSKDLAKVDLWSTGITMYALFTNRLLTPTLSFKNLSQALKTEIEFIVQLLGPPPIEDLPALVDPQLIGTVGQKSPDSPPIYGYMINCDGSWNTSFNFEANGIPTTPVKEQVERASQQLHSPSPQPEKLQPFITLLQKMIAWPSKRSTATELLAHEFFISVPVKDKARLQHTAS